MIEVKGTKTTAPEADASQRYALKNADKKTQTPVVLGVFLTGLALYLKSIFPSWSISEEGEPSTEGDAPGEARPRLALAEVLPPPSDAARTTSEPAAGNVANFGGRLAELQTFARFKHVEAPAISDFLQPEASLDWQGPLPSAKPARHANDNAGLGPAAPAGGNSSPAGDIGPGGTAPGETVPGPGTPGGADPGGTQPRTDPVDPECPVVCAGSPDAEPCDEDEENRPPTGNRAPRVTGPVYLADVTGCAILAIGLTDLLGNAYDPDGDTLSVRNLTVSSGTLTQSGAGWIFQGGSQLLGPVTVTYQVTDGEFVVEQLAHFAIVGSAMDGTDGDDLLLGSMYADGIDGGRGDDNIDARAGDDLVNGGRGNDHIVAGDGDDTVFGGHGDDIVLAGKGNDRISGGDGDDRLFGEEGDDIVFGDGGNDYLSGGDGNDVLSGGDGDDIMLDGAGEDVLLGEAGDDTVIAALDKENDVYDGGEGRDMLDYSATQARMSIDLVQGIAIGEETGSDAVIGFEAVRGGSGDDQVIGSAGDDALHGNAGDDELNGGTGSDLIEGGSGDDLMLDGGGADEIHGGSGDDHLVAAQDWDDDVYDGGEGCDTLDYSNSAETLTVDLTRQVASGIEIGEDCITGFEKVMGGRGDDRFVAGEDSVTFVGGEGENTFEFTGASEPVQPSPILHEILDFKVGDRIRMSKYDIFEEVFDELEDRFEDIYGDDVDDDDVAIRYRHDRTDERDRTIIEADFNDDDIYETTINLQGHHVLVIVEHA